MFSFSGYQTIGAVKSPNVTKKLSIIEIHYTDTMGSLFDGAHVIGGAFGRVTPENFGKPGYADYRNPNIAEIMKTLGFVQRFGVGIQMAQRELKLNGNPPAEFKVELTSVLCIIKEGERTKNAIPWIDENENRPESQPESRLESKLAVKVMMFLHDQELGKSEIAKLLKHKTVSGGLHKQIKRLGELDYIEMTIPEKPNSRLQKYRLTEKGRYQIKPLP